MADRVGLLFSSDLGCRLEWAVRSGLLRRAYPVYHMDLRSIARVDDGDYFGTARYWWRAASMSLLPLATFVAIAQAGTIWPLAMEAGERIHFQAARRSYLEEVSKLPSSGEPRFAIWRWGGLGIGHAVVYDESDEIVLPEQSPAWKKRVANTEIALCGAWGSSLGNHFYLVRTGC